MDAGHIASIVGILGVLVMVYLEFKNMGAKAAELEAMKEAARAQQNRTKYIEQVKEKADEARKNGAVGDNRGDSAERMRADDFRAVFGYDRPDSNS